MKKETKNNSLFYLPSSLLYTLHLISYSQYLQGPQGPLVILRLLTTNSGVYLVFLPNLAIDYYFLSLYYFLSFKGFFQFSLFFFKKCFPGLRTFDFFGVVGIFTCFHYFKFSIKKIYTNIIITPHATKITSGNLGIRKGQQIFCFVK